jgi:quinol-cytochrome oxidoreductase complex cytochrome b subunit
MRFKLNKKFFTNRESKSLLTFNNIRMLLPINAARITKSYLPAFFINHLVNYPTPISLTYAWSFGSLAGITLIIQMITGIFLSMHYTANIELAFKSIEYIMRDVPNGWLIRYIHANGASMFFIVIYGHVCRGLYYGSYTKPRQLLWCSGVVLLFLMMATAFTGYVLPWGQMSLWGATVITSMVTVIPVAGKYILQWLWGGYTIKNPTLVRFYTLHFVLPFLIAGFTLIHIALLHKVGSSRPVKSENGADDISFYPYFVSKDLFAFSVYLLVFAFFVLYYPNFLNHPVNYIPANPMRTPAHVVPEWYFLPYYAILRSIPHKTGGILAMLGSLLVLFLIPFINTSKTRNTTDRPIFKLFFWIFISDILVLTWVGQKPVRDAFIFTGQIATVYYFFFFLIILPAVGILENSLLIPKSSDGVCVNSKQPINGVNKIKFFKYVLIIEESIRKKLLRMSYLELLILFFILGISITTNVYLYDIIQNQEIHTIALNKILDTKDLTIEIFEFTNDNLETKISLLESTDIKSSPKSSK